MKNVDVNKTSGATDPDNQGAPERREVLQLLPSIHQTETLKRFFANSVDNLFQPDNVKKISGYVGQRPYYWDINNEFYLPEQTVRRSAYQLSPAMTSKTSGAISDVLFYDDLLNYLRFSGANTTNPNRLFGGKYYSWCPPIDVDKFTAFRNYVWLESGPNPLTVTDSIDVEADIIGQENASIVVNGNAVDLVNGLRVIFENPTDPQYADKPFTVEGVGTSIILVGTEESQTFPWDTTPWDETAWDTTYSSSGAADVESGPDYFVIARGASDRNPWSTGNKWYHIDILAVTGTEPDQELSELRATRPILEFDRDLELYRYGNASIEVDAVLTVPYSDVQGKRVWYPTKPLDDPDNQQLGFYGSQGYAAFKDTNDIVRLLTTDNSANEYNGFALHDGATVLLTDDMDASANNRIYTVTGIESTGSINLIPTSYVSQVGDVIRVRYGIEYGTTTVTRTAVGWNPGVQKQGRNDPPLFALYDYENIALDDAGIYPSSDFAGSKIFGYQEDLDNTALEFDPVLGMRLVYDSEGEIVFENFITTERYSYANNTDINGYYFFRKTESTPEYQSDWIPAEFETKQYIIDEFIVAEAQTEFELTTSPDADQPGNTPNLVIEYNGNNITDYAITDNVVTISSVPLEAGTPIIFKTYNADYQGNQDTYFEVPKNLQYNPKTEDITTITSSDFFDHFKEMMELQVGFEGRAYGVNNWRNTAQNRSFGQHIIQHDTPLLKTMLTASVDDFDIMRALRFVEREYSRTQNKFANTATKMIASGSFSSTLLDDQVMQILEAVNVGKTSSFPFYYSDMIKTGSMIPSTAQNLGVLQPTEPYVYLDETLPDARWILVGHDGSKRYINGTVSASSRTTTVSDLDEQIDQLIFRMEQMIYENIPSQFKDQKPLYDVSAMMPGAFRETEYTRQEVLDIMQPMFERWVSTTGADYRENLVYSPDDRFSWNYSNAKTIQGVLGIGNWRGLYTWFYDTDTPHLTPWRMLGLTSKPAYWDAEYGPAPYTSSNIVLWQHLEQGYIAAGDDQGYHIEFARPGLSQIIPVDVSGNLLDPIAANVVVGQVDLISAKKPWKFGDIAPVENVWRWDSLFSYAVAQTAFLMKPAAFVEYNWDAGNAKVLESSQQLINTTLYKRLMPSEEVLHTELQDDSVVIRHGIQQWIADMLISRGQSVTSTLGNRVRSLDVNLSHRMGGFTDSDSLFALTDNFGLIPSEDINTLLYNSASLSEYSYSGVIVRWNGKAWQVFGYDVLNPEFKIYPVLGTGLFSTVKVGEDPETAPHWQPARSYAQDETVTYQAKIYNALEAHTSTQNFDSSKWRYVGSSVGNSTTVRKYKEFDDRVVSVPYGTQFNTQQDVFNFLMGYEQWLESQGWVFDDFESTSNRSKNWTEAGRDFLFWTQTRFSAGNFIALSPFAERVKFNADFGSVQGVEQVINGVYSLLNRDGFRIDPRDTDVTRYDNEVEIVPENSIIYGARLYVKSVEHALVFNNTTIFGDVIYDTKYGVIQPRIKLNGVLTNNWQGRLYAPGYIIQESSIYENFEKTVSDFEKYYAIEDSVDNVTLREHSRHLVGYQPRSYFDSLLIDPDTSFQFYQGLIQAKGTAQSLEKFVKASEARLNKNLTIFEEWAFRHGRFGGLDINPTLEFEIGKTELTDNPQLIQFGSNYPSEDYPYDDVIKIDDSDSRWKRKPNNIDGIWETRTSYSDQPGDLLSAGYVHLSDVDYTSVDLEGVRTAYLNALLDNTTAFADNERVWVYRADNDFQVYKLSNENNEIVSVTDAGNNRTELEFNTTTNLSAGQMFFVKTDTKNQTGATLQGLHKIISVSGTTVVVEFTTDQDVVFDTPVSLQVMRPLRFATESDVAAYTHYVDGDMVWIDDGGAATEKQWRVDVLQSNVWQQHRLQQLKVKTENKTSAVIYSNITNQTVATFEVLDPRKGLIPGAADRDIEYKTPYDPAVYTDGDESQVSIHAQRAWGDNRNGKIWWDVSTALFLEYEQGSDEYKTNNWGKLAPGATVDIYEWTKSPVSPYDYSTVIGTDRIDVSGKYYGTVKDENNPAWVEKEEYNPVTGFNETVYYFWVQNNTSKPAYEFRSKSARAVADIITQPTKQSVLWFSPVNVSAMTIANTYNYINSDETIMQINWWIDKQVNTHSEWVLLREGDENSLPDDRLWNKMRDSLVGEDATGLTVPDPALSDVERYGNEIRPRQTWFKDIDLARYTFVDLVNQIMSRTAVRLTRPDYANNLFDSGTGYDVQTVWDYADYYDAERVSKTTVPTYEYATQTDFENAVVAGQEYTDTDVIDIALDNNGDHVWMMYADGDFITVFVENGTIEFDLSAFGTGVDFKSAEMRIVVDSLRSDILLDSEINETFFLMVNHVHSEQNQVDWAFKTSFIVISGLEDSVGQQPVQVTDTTGDLVNYIEEAKPYHVKIRDFKELKRLAMDQADFRVTDFDRPPYEGQILDDVADQEQLSTERPWSEWYSVYQQDPNPVRKVQGTLKFDRVKCTTEITPSGTYTDNIVMMADAYDSAETVESGRAIYSIATVNNSTIEILSAQITAYDESVTHVSDGLSRSYKLPKQLLAANTLSVSVNGTSIYEYGTVVDNSYHFELDGNYAYIVFDDPIQVGLEVIIRVDETLVDEFGNPATADVTIGTVASNDALLPLTALDFAGSNTYPINKTAQYSTDMFVSYNKGNAVRGAVTIALTYNVKKNVGAYDVTTVDAADRIQLYYKPTDNMPALTTERVERSQRIKGTTLFGKSFTSLLDTPFNYFVPLVPGCMYKGTIVEGIRDDYWLDALGIDVEINPDIGLPYEIYEYISTGQFTWDTVGWDTQGWSAEEDLKVVLPFAVSVSSDLRVVASPGVLTEGTDYVYNSADNSIDFVGYAPSYNEKIVVMDVGTLGTTFAELSTDPADIIIEGNTFHQPHWDSERPEELIPLATIDSVQIRAYFSGESGSPVIQTHRFISDGVTQRYGLEQTPQSSTGIFVFVDETYQVYGDDYRIDWTENELVFEDAGSNSTVPANGTIVKITTFGYGGDGVAYQKTYPDGGNTFEMPRAFASGSVLVFVNGEEETTVDVQGKQVTIPATTDTVNLVAFDTQRLQRIVQTDSTNTSFVLDDAYQENQLVVLKNGDAVAYTYNQGTQTLDITDSVGVSDQITIEVYETISPSLVDTQLFAGDGSSPNTSAGPVANSLEFDIGRDIENTLPKHNSVIVRRDGLRLSTFTTYYKTVTPQQFVYFADDKFTNPATISMLVDDTVQTFGVDFAAPKTYQGVLQSDIALDDALTANGTPAAGLAPGDWFVIENANVADNRKDFAGTWQAVAVNEIDAKLVKQYDVSDVLTPAEIASGACPTTISGTVTPTEEYYELNSPLVDGTAVVYLGNGKWSKIQSRNIERGVLNPSKKITTNFSDLGITQADLKSRMYFVIEATSNVRNFQGEEVLNTNNEPIIDVSQTYADGDILQWNGSVFERVQIDTSLYQEIHFAEYFGQTAEMRFWDTSETVDFDVTDDSVIVYDVNAASEYSVTTFSIDETLEIRTYVFEENREGEYVISSTPYSSDHIWLTVDGERKTYMRDYLLSASGSGWDSSSWDNSTSISGTVPSETFVECELNNLEETDAVQQVTIEETPTYTNTGISGWDLPTASRLVKMGRFEGTDEQWANKTKSKIVVTVLSGTPASPPFAYRTFIDSFGEQYLERIADRYTTELRSAISADSTSIEILANRFVAEEDFELDYVYKPTAGTVGVVWINAERIEYSTVEGPFYDGTRRYWRLSNLTRGSKATIPADHAINESVYRAGKLESMTYVIGATSANTLNVSTSTITPNSNIVPVAAYPKETIKWSLYAYDGSSYNLISPSEYEMVNTINTNNEVTGCSAQFTNAITTPVQIVYATPEELNLQAMTNDSVRFLQQYTGTYEE